MALGFPHPRILQQHLSSADITYWRAYARLEPFGESREDARAGTIAALLYNTNRPKGADPRAWYDFFPNVSAPKENGQQEQQQSPEQKKQLADRAIALFKAFNTRWAPQKRK